MSSILDIALTGLRYSTRGIEISARNIANVNTDGYRSRSHRPVTDTADPRHASSTQVPESAPGAPPPSDVDLATEIVDLKRHQIGYRANAALVRVADRLSGELLDVLA